MPYEGLRIDEHLLADGQRTLTQLCPVSSDSFGLMVDRGPLVELPLDVLDKVMARYGKPLADDVRIEGPSLELPGGRTLTVNEARLREGGGRDRPSSPGRGRPGS